MEHLKYPIGQFKRPLVIKPAKIEKWIAEIEAVPSQMRALTENLSEEELELPYRPGGWTIRQVVHHTVDSHINSYVRFKWALTEDNPTIKAYYEERWAELEDYNNTPVSVSLNMMEGLHIRWTNLLKSLTPEQLKRTYIHPSGNKTFKVDETIGMYAWHGNHHIAHIKLALGLEI